MQMQNYLQESEYVDYSNRRVAALAKSLSRGCESDEEIAKRCFTYVRDEIKHSGDHKESVTTYRASDVLKYGTGWCYAKAILLAALLRANAIPTAFCYQRLSCSEYGEDIYCLHGLNAIHLKEYGWYRVDARGNKKGVDAQFEPPEEKLAFMLQENEFDIEELYSEPLPEVIEALRKNKSYEEMIQNFPDIKVESKKSKEIEKEIAQVKIYGLKKSLEKIKVELSKTIHTSIVDVLDFSQENRFHRFMAFDEDSMLFPDTKSEHYTIIEIMIMEGHTVQTKKKLIQALFENIENALGIGKGDIEICIIESPACNWGF